MSNKSAEKMFENLGYFKNIEENELLNYKKVVNSGIYEREIYEIEFWIEDKTVVKNYFGDEIDSDKFRTTMQELQAINKKCEELRMDIEEEWRKDTLKQIEEGKVIVSYIETDEEGNTIIGYIQKIC